MIVSLVQSGLQVCPQIRDLAGRLRCGIKLRGRASVMLVAKSSRACSTTGDTAPYWRCTSHPHALVSSFRFDLFFVLVNHGIIFIWSPAAAPAAVAAAPDAATGYPTRSRLQR
jgi:hypothetical protein